MVARFAVRLRDAGGVGVRGIADPCGKVDGVGGSFSSRSFHGYLFGNQPDDAIQRLTRWGGLWCLVGALSFLNRCCLGGEDPPPGVPLPHPPLPPGGGGGATSPPRTPGHAGHTLDTPTVAMQPVLGRLRFGEPPPLCYEPDRSNTTLAFALPHGVVFRWSG